MALFRVIFKNRVDSKGEPLELPADKLNANGAMIESYGFVERVVNKGEDFSRDIWEYEILDQDADRFIEGLKISPTVIEYKRQ